MSEPHINSVWQVQRRASRREPWYSVAACQTDAKACAIFEQIRHSMCRGAITGEVRMIRDDHIPLARCDSEWGHVHD